MSPMPHMITPVWTYLCAAGHTSHMDLVSTCDFQFCSRTAILSEILAIYPLIATMHAFREIAGMYMGCQMVATVNRAPSFHSNWFLTALEQRFVTTFRAPTLIPKHTQKMQGRQANSLPGALNQCTPKGAAGMLMPALDLKKQKWLDTSMGEGQRNMHIALQK